MLAGQVSLEGTLAVLPGGERQDQLPPGGRDPGADRPHHTGEERLPEQPVLALGDDQGDGVRPAGDQGPGGEVRHVAELGDRREDGLPGALGHLRGPVDDARDRAAPDPGAGGDLVERRALAGGGHRVSIPVLGGGSRRGNKNSATCFIRGSSSNVIFVQLKFGGKVVQLSFL